MKISYQDDSADIELHLLKVSDAEQIHAAVIQSLPHLKRFMDWAHQALSVEKQRERIGTLPDDEYHFVMRDRTSEALLMCASLQSAKTMNKNSLAIGYWTVLPHANKGLATLASQLLTIFAIDSLHSDRLEIGCNKLNTPSRRVIEKCGFTKEGEIRNYFTAPTPQMIDNGYTSERTCNIYSILPEELPALTWYPIISKKMKIIES